MLAPVIAAPDGSVTEPVTEPVICCPDSGNAKIRANATLNVDTRSFGKRKRTMIHPQTSRNAEYGLMFLRLCFRNAGVSRTMPTILVKPRLFSNRLSQRFQLRAIAIDANPMIGEA